MVLRGGGVHYGLRVGGRGGVVYTKMLIKCRGYAQTTAELQFSFCKYLFSSQTEAEKLIEKLDKETFVSYSKINSENVSDF